MRFVVGLLQPKTADNVVGHEIREAVAAIEKLIPLSLRFSVPSPVLPTTHNVQTAIVEGRDLYTSNVWVGAPVRRLTCLLTYLLIY